MARHNSIGKWGEQLAYEYLVARGYAILERNWRMGHLETDIIAMKGPRIIFVEVKTRTNPEDDPLKAVDSKRMRHMISSARGYINRYAIKHEYQFDIITVWGDPIGDTPPKIEHIPDAFLPPLRTVR